MSSNEVRLALVFSTLALSALSSLRDYSTCTEGRHLPDERRGQYRLRSKSHSGGAALPRVGVCPTSTRLTPDTGV